MDRVYLPFYRQFMIKDRAAFDASARTLLEEWEWDRLLPCHGSFVPEGGKALLRAHLGLEGRA
uniref:Uncharacterized protein n=1 Tax=Tetraselmis sp. GSL018 TaxID=582737 RepID=A0A061S1Y5_9CHLO